MWLEHCHPEEYIDTVNLCHFKERLKDVFDKMKEGCLVERAVFFTVTIPLK